MGTNASSASYPDPNHPNLFPKPSSKPKINLSFKNMFLKVFWNCSFPAAKAHIAVCFTQIATARLDQQQAFFPTFLFQSFQLKFRSNACPETKRVGAEKSPRRLGHVRDHDVCCWRLSEGVFAAAAGSRVQCYMSGHRSEVRGLSAAPDGPFPFLEKTVSRNVSNPRHIGWRKHAASRLCQETIRMATAKVRRD